MTFPRNWDGVSPTRPDPDINRSPDGLDWKTLIYEHQVLPRLTPLDIAGLTPFETGVYKHGMTLENVALTLTDTAGNGGQGALKVLEFPALLEGCAVLACYMDITFTSDGAAGVPDNCPFICSIGTTPVSAADDTLTSLEANIIASQASLGMGVPFGRITPTPDGPAHFTGTTTGFYVNVIADDASITGDGEILLNGTLSFIWTPWR